MLGGVNMERDWGWAPEYVEAYWRMLQVEKPSDYIIATGETNSLAAFVEETFSQLGLKWRDYVTTDPSLSRPCEFQATRVDPTKARLELNWRAKYHMRDVVRLLLAQLAPSN